MTTPADLVRDNAAQLRRLHPRLEHALTQAASGDGGMAPRPADAPFPGDPAAFADADGHLGGRPPAGGQHPPRHRRVPRRRRGGDPRHFLAALESVVALSGGLDEDGEALAARVLERLADVARRVRAIDEAEQWRPVRSRACPRCGCFFLKVLLDAAGSPGGAHRVLRARRVRGAVPGDVGPPRRYRPGPGRLTAMPWPRGSTRKASAPTAAGSSPVAPTASKLTPPTAAGSSSGRITGGSAPATPSPACPPAATGASPASGADQ